MADKLSYIKRETVTELTTICDCLEYYAVAKAEQESFIFVSSDFTREVVSWAELYEKSRVTAKALIHLGVKRDEVVAINVRTCPQWLYLAFGAMMAGARPVGITFTYTDGSDLIAMMKKLEACSLVVVEPGVDSANWNIVKSIIDVQGDDGSVSSLKMPYLRYLIAHEQGDTPVMEGILHFNDFIRDVPEDIQLPMIGEDDIASLFQTSGSTGVPKLVAHTHKSLMAMRQLGTGTGSMIQFNDRPFPWIGGYPLNVIFGQRRVTLAGACTISGDHVKFLIEVIRREQCVIFQILPPLLHEFIIRQDELNFDWSVGFISVGGQPLSKGFARCLGKMTPMLMNGYGCTECPYIAYAVATNPAHFQENSCGTVGDLLGMELKIVDEDGEIVPINTRGEIFIRSPAMFKEYYNDPVKTAAVKSRDGWYRTDDLGRLDENEMLFVEGRKSNMIISGGMNVLPDLIERVIELHPAVASAVISPVPDEAYYEVLCACVLTNPGNDVTELQLRSFLEEYINDKPGLFTVLPEYYMILKEFPELLSGKTNRKMLAEKAVKEFSK